MTDALYITVVRDGETLKLPIGKCTRGEMTTYFEALTLDELKPWTYMLLGMVFGSSQRIEELESALKSFRG